MNADNKGSISLKRWISLAVRRDIVLNSLKVCLVVGTILVLINYFDRLFGGELARIDYVKILLMYCVPYCVSTYGSVSIIIREKS